MQKHRIEIRVLCVLQKAKHWGEGIESEVFKLKILRVRILSVKVWGVKILTVKVKATNGVWEVLGERGRGMV